jgi:transcriptional regulator with XRE-family HTH domain
VNTLLGHIGYQVRFHRESQKMTVRELANISNLSQAMISEIENGNKACSLKTLQKLSTVLRIPMTTFFAIEGPENSISFELQSVIHRAEVQRLLLHLAELDDEQIKLLIKYIEEFMSG